MFFLNTKDECAKFFYEFEAALKAKVDFVVQELRKPIHRQSALLRDKLVEIDAHVRKYPVFYASVNRVRMQEERGVETRERLFEIRRNWGELHAHISLFNIEMNSWWRARKLAAQQITTKRTSLYVPEGKIPDATREQTVASDAVFRLLLPLINPESQTDEAKENKCFPDIGLPNSDFHAHMHAAYRIMLSRNPDRPVRFLDVGCGCGLKVFTARQYFAHAQGFDFDANYIAVANRFFGADEVDGDPVFFEQDAVTYDGYDQFDVIYFYRPIDDDDRLTELERRIAQTAKPGTILIAPYLSFPVSSDDLGCAHIAGAVYLAKTTAHAAARVRAMAERMGPYVDPGDYRPSTTIWEPIFKISRERGFGLPETRDSYRY